MGWQPFPIKYGHAPDLDPTSPDAWLIIGAMPYENGIGTQYYHSPASSATGVGTPMSGLDMDWISGNGHVIVGTNVAIYKYRDASNLFSTISGTLSASNWSFAKFGYNVLAADLSTAVLRYTGTGTFTAAGNAPKAKMIVNAGFPSAPQIFAFDYDDGVNAYDDGWYCSALSTDTSWTVNYASGCASGRLLEPTGRFTAAISFRDGVVAFKKDAMYYGEYAPDGVNVIQWRRLSSAIGCIGMHALCHADDVIYFAGLDGFYMYDGSYPQKLPGYVHNEFAQQYPGITESYGDDWYCTFYRTWGIVVWTKRSHTKASVTGDGYAYNTRSRLWTRTRESRYHNQTDVDALAFRLNGEANMAVLWDTSVSGFVVGQLSNTIQKNAIITTPRIGNGGGVTISGVWPYWFFKDEAYETFDYGPSPGTEWARDGTASLLLSFQAFAAPQLITPTTTVTGVPDNQLGRGSGSVSNRWGSVNFAVGGNYLYRFSSVMLDVRYGPRST